MKIYFDERRIQIGEYVGKEIYVDGLFILLQYLFCDLSDLLEEEGRRFGIVLSYLDSIYNACKNVDLSYEEESSQKIIYLVKPLVKSEYKRLTKKKLSKADSVIVLIRSFLSIMMEYSQRKELVTLWKIISKLFDNIRNKSKNTSLEKMSDVIRSLIETGSLGKYKLDHFSLLEEKPKTPLVGSGVRIKNETDNKILEVTWKEE